MSIRTIVQAIFIICLASPSAPVIAQDASPAGPIPVDFLESRREGLLEALGGFPAILSSAGPRGEYAQDSDYREDNNFLYLTGIEAPGAWLVMNGGKGEEVVLYLPPRSPDAERWTGEQLGPGEDGRSLTGLDLIRSTEELEGDLHRWFGGSRGSEAPSRDTLFAWFGHEALKDRLDGLLPSEAPEARSLGPFLASLRIVKDGEEIRRLRRAVDITSEAHREIWRIAEPGIAEYQVEGTLEFVFKIHGAERVGFPSIVGSGPNGVILHYDENRRILEAGDLVVVDIGAEFGYYTADITRTFPASGRFTTRQKALYDLVLGTREAGLREFRPGGTIRKVNEAARSYLQTHSGDLCGEASCAPYLIHGVSHWLGMDVHDVGNNQTPFRPGMVLTLEPGLYLPEEALGIRIEDDILITADGHEVLSHALPRTTGEIEAVMEEEPRWIKNASTGGGKGADGPWIRNGHGTRVAG